MTMHPLLREAVLRFAVAFSALLTLEHLYGLEVINAILPVLQAELEWIGDSYRILGLTITTHGGDSVIRVDAVLEHYVWIGSRMLAPNPGLRLIASTVTGTVFRPMIVACVLMSTWPARHASEWPRRFLIGFPLMLLLFPFDVPLMLLGGLHETLAFLAHEPGHNSLLMAWRGFLQNGGAIALSLMVGVCAIALARRAEFS